MKSPEQVPLDGPIIRLVENRDVMEAKLKEYESRLDKFKAPELQLDTIYKIAVAKSLVETGEVDTHNLSMELNNRYGFLDERLFDNACGVISDYISSGGKNLRGGTGLNGINIDKPSDVDMVM